MKRLILAFVLALTTFLLPAREELPLKYVSATQIVTATFSVPISTFVSTPTPKPKATPTSTMASTPTPEVNTYTVKPGDTLWGIANSFGLTVESLAFTNNITDPSLIFPNQVIVIQGDKLGTEPTPPIPDILIGKEIVVVIHTQRTYTFENGELLKTFVVSTGVAKHPTVLGKFRIQVKLDFDDMTDNLTYYLPKVPWVMYFGNDDVSWHEGYSLHGTYWHHNFGTPMSHGCVNLSIPDAEWLYNWSDPVPKGSETDATESNPGTIVWIIP